MGIGRTVRNIQEFSNFFGNLEKKKVASGACMLLLLLLLTIGLLLALSKSVLELLINILRLVGGTGRISE